MALTVGTRLGHDDVTALIGEGGMGQVWQATDTQLNRQVALKILPDAFAADPDRLARVALGVRRLVFDHPRGLMRVAAAGGAPELIVEELEGRASKPAGASGSSSVVHNGLNPHTGRDSARPGNRILPLSARV